MVEYLLKKLIMTQKIHDHIEYELSKQIKLMLKILVVDTEIVMAPELTNIY